MTKRSLNNNFLGQLGRYLGEFENTEKGHRTQVFVLYVDSLDPEELWEESVRERRWFSLQEAKEVLKTNKPNHVKYIDKMIQTKAASATVASEQKTSQPSCLHLCTFSQCLNMIRVFRMTRVSLQFYFKEIIPSIRLSKATNLVHVAALSCFEAFRI